MYTTEQLELMSLVHATDATLTHSLTSQDLSLHKTGVLCRAAMQPSFYSICRHSSTPGHGQSTASHAHFPFFPTGHSTLDKNYCTCTVRAPNFIHQCNCVSPIEVSALTQNRLRTHCPPRPGPFSQITCSTPIDLTANPHLNGGSLLKNSPKHEPTHTLFTSS
jgi:hypothetical protein